MLWILGILLLLILLICLLRIRVLVYLDEKVSAELRIGPIRVLVELSPQITAELRIGPVHKSVYPSAKPKNEKATKPEKKSGEKKAIPKPGISDIKDAYHALKPAVIRALRRTRRGIRIHPLKLSVIFGGREDPAKAAQTYGYASAAVWTVMPVLEQLLTIPDPRIHLDMDFESETLRVRGSAGISIRIGTLLLVALGVAIPAIRWFLKYMKRTKETKQQPAQAPAA